MKKKQTQKIEFDQSIVQNKNSEIAIRPNSGKLAPIIKSPLPPRKATLSQHQKQRKNQQELQLSQDIKVIKIRSITPNEQKIVQYYNASPVKLIQKQQAVQSEKKIIVIPKRPEKQQFRITNKINSSAEKKSSQLKGSNNQGYEFNWINHESTQIIEFNNQKKNNIREQHYKQQKQEFKKTIPKCVKDFSMTSHKNDLPQLLKNYQQEFKDVHQQYMHDNPPPLNMSEIMEINEDGFSSLAQSTYHHQIH
ncbi:unnamed protein product [Paramecium sonneborni]|uniref:Uncharacterized protein n=1 Tax=Paramecium sonneborni TaxID=65129 RepID=A0A8S1MWZ2_9CILI|nr:unnamed protein product [Paramecium sonneborni]